MAKIKVSVILTTARFGGLDIIYHSMQAQTIKERFEVILVDEFYQDRAANIAGSKLGFPAAKFEFLHLPPRRMSSIYDDTAGFNSGIAAAHGELLVFLIDYLWAPADYLEAHWSFYKGHPGWSMSCYMDRYATPLLKEVRGWENGTWEWSTFAEEFTAERAVEFFAANEPTYRERRGLCGIVHDDGTVEIPGDFAYMIGESMPMETLKSLNGWDERYCGGYGSNDIDLGTRANHIGHRFALNPYVKLRKMTLSGQAQIPGKAKPKVRAPEDNYRFFQTRRQAITSGRESPRVPSGWGAFE